MSTVEQVAEAVLYEGYLLFPYRPSARKNQQRWTFGGVYPRGADDPSEMQTQCLLCAQPLPLPPASQLLPRPPRRARAGVREAHPSVSVTVRFLQVISRVNREEAIERSFPTELRLGERRITPIHIPASNEAGPAEATWQPLQGDIETWSERVQEDLWRLTVTIRNLANWGADTREQALRRTFVSTHTILRSSGDFVSLLEPPAELQQPAASCRNVGTWPVLVDDQHTMLSSPIILYDYPEVSPQSPGALFDTTEIDELLTLSVLALTDEEKAEVRAADARGRELLERTESLSPEQILELHGVLRELR